MMIVHNTVLKTNGIYRLLGLLSFSKDFSIPKGQKILKAFFLEAPLPPKTNEIHIRQNSAI